jgi:UDP-N-acetylglucosamine acyltransferase
VVAGDFAVIGGMAGVVQFVRIGRMGMVGGYSKLDRDVLPFSIADGIPAELRIINKINMERNGKGEQVKEVHDAFKTIVRSGMTLEEAAADLRERYPDSAEIAEMLEFAEQSDRGLARPKG